MSGMEAMRRMALSRKGDRQAQGTASRKGKGDVEERATYEIQSWLSRGAAKKREFERARERIEREQRAALELLKTRKAINSILPRKNAYDI